MCPVAESRRDRQPAGRRACRRGATAVELAIVVTVFLALVLGMLDVGIAVYRSHVLANAARELGRQAITRGSMAPFEREWGPTTYVGTASSTDSIPAAVQPFLPGLDLSQVTVQVAWPEGSNGLEKPVQVTMSMPYQPLMTSFLGISPFTLSGSSTMQIVH